MSFIDLMGDVVWTDDDITNRTEAMVAQAVPLTNERILVRKVLTRVLHHMGMLPSIPAEIIATLTEDVDEYMQTFASALIQAAQAGIEARADMQLLREAMAYEKALLRMSQPSYSGPTTIITDSGVEQPHPDYLCDQQEVEAASTLVHNTSPEGVALALTRENYRRSYVEDGMDGSTI